jgi:hypothetical protein
MSWKRRAELKSCVSSSTSANTCKTNHASADAAATRHFCAPGYVPRLRIVADSTAAFFLAMSPTTIFSSMCIVLARVKTNLHTLEGPLTIWPSLDSLKISASELNATPEPSMTRPPIAMTRLSLLSLLHSKRWPSFAHPPMADYHFHSSGGQARDPGQSSVRVKYKTFSRGWQSQTPLTWVYPPTRASFRWPRCPSAPTETLSRRLSFSFTTLSATRLTTSVCYSGTAWNTKSSIYMCQRYWSRTRIGSCSADWVQSAVARPAVCTVYSTCALSASLVQQATEVANGRCLEDL